MITSRLTRIKQDLQFKTKLSSHEQQLLLLITRMDEAEQNIVRAFRSRDRELLIEMIIKPKGEECNICGRGI